MPRDVFNFERGAKFHVLGETGGCLCGKTKFAQAKKMRVRPPPEIYSICLECKKRLKVNHPEYKRHKEVLRARAEYFDSIKAELILCKQNTRTGGA